MDSSESGVEAVFSQSFGDKPKLQLLAFYSKKFLPAEQNYNVWNGELLVVKLTLEVWDPWVEGAAYQFAIFTGHKTLEYQPSTWTHAKPSGTCSLQDSISHTCTSLVPKIFNLTLCLVSMRLRTRTEMWTHTVPLLLCMDDNLGHWHIISTPIYQVPSACLPNPCATAYSSSPRATPLITYQSCGWAHKSPATGHPSTQRTYCLLKALLISGQT